ncbi:hypothetical protein V1524DRAFT_412192 [Lipomyces starkeyi]
MNSPTFRDLVINVLTKRRDEQQEKSGEAEADTDLKQATDSFLIPLDTVNAVAGSGKDKRKVDTAKDREATDRSARIQKRTWGCECGNVLPLKRAAQVDVRLDPTMSRMVDVFERTANAIAATPPPPSPDDGRMAKLEERVGEVADELKSVKSMLSRLLERFGRVSALASALAVWGFVYFFLFFFGPFGILN